MPQRHKERSACRGRKCFSEETCDAQAGKLKEAHDDVESEVTADDDDYLYGVITF